MKSWWFTFALRSLVVRPVRAAVLACGFGLGIAVMAELLGVGEVILEQSRSPALQGGGDVVMSGALGSIDNARFTVSSARGPAGGPSRIAAASPWRRESLYLMKGGKAIPIIGRGGVPSLERAVGDPEVSGVSNWTDGAADARWTRFDAGDLLRAMDGFHRQPDVPEFASSWAEWLYFNGRTADGRVRFYLTFLVGPSSGPGKRTAGVRLQLDRDGTARNYMATGDVDEAAVLAHAPDLDIAGNHVRLEDARYRIALRLQGEGGGPGVTGELTLDPIAGRSLPPVVFRGARGWLSGYVVPVLSGRIAGALAVGRDTVSLDDAIGYHDHNWGFWRGVRWQWGQVAGQVDGEDVSLVYGRIFPPTDVADPDRLPGFLGVLDKNGLAGVATNVSIVEQRGADGPSEVEVVARGSAIDLRLRFSVEHVIRTRMGLTGGTADFLQLRGTYQVEGRAGDRAMAFTARGAAETFQPR